MKSLKTLFVIFSVLVVFVFLNGLARAIPMAELTYVETDLGGGIWQYDYTVTNAADPVLDAGFNLYDVFFTFDSAVTLTVASLPTDWDAIDGTDFVDAFSLAPGAPPVGADIAPGTSLSGFVFQFDAQVGDLPFTVAFENPEELTEPFYYDGTSAVPEPSTILLISSGLIGLAIFRRKFRR